MTPFVTVVVPTLNRREWVIEAVESLRAQDYPPDRFEVIAVDNGSRDGAWEWLVAAALLPGPQLRCFRNETKYKVPSGSRNVGIGRAAGEIVGFTDSDCVASPDWIRNGVAAFREGVGIVVGRTIALPGARLTPLSKIKVVDSVGFFDTCNIFYTREVLGSAGGFDAAIHELSPTRTVYGEDTELGIRVEALGYRAAFAADAVVQHRVRSQTFWQWLTDPFSIYWCPYLVRRHPRIRRDMLFLRYFLTPATALFDLLLAGAVLSWVAGPWYGLLGLPFAVAKLSESASRRSPLLRLARLAGGSVRALFIFGVLLSGSVRYRRLVI